MSVMPAGIAAGQQLATFFARQGFSEMKHGLLPRI